ncbi:MAG: NUDIX hydrolase [Ahrensia sp.]
MMKLPAMTLTRKHMPKSTALRPRLAASLITIDHNDGTPLILMGRRSDAHVFMPGYHVFPGGGVERQDYRGADVLEPAEVECVLRGLPARATANTAQTIARAALREMTEETGFQAKNTDALRLHYLGRAITPPGQVRRYDTRFFISTRSNFEPAPSAPDNELLELEWVDIAQLDKLKIHRITAFMLQQTQRFLTAGKAAQRPCVHTRYGKQYIRDE